MLTAAAPGAGTGASLTLQARADLAVSAALQGMLAPLDLASVPLWPQLSGRDVVPSRVVRRGLAACGLAGQVTPVVVAIWLRRRDPGRADRVHRVSRRSPMCCWPAQSGVS